jgi:hypothetical protein
MRGRSFVDEEAVGVGMRCEEERGSGQRGHEQRGEVKVKVVAGREVKE